MASAKWPAQESDLAEPVIEYLKDLQWEVYQEVDAGHVADIVATQGHLLWVIELKRTLSLEVMAQASYWRDFAHYVSVAVPFPKRISYNRGRAFAEQVLRWRGIGLLQVTAPNPTWQPAEVNMHFILQPRLNRKPLEHYLRPCICEEQKTFATAGNADGRRWTPFKQTCQAVAEYVAKRPGVCMKRLVDNIPHHYASDAGARVHLKEWIEAGKVPGVEIRRDGRLLRVYPCEGD